MKNLLPLAITIASTLAVDVDTFSPIFLSEEEAEVIWTTPKEF